MSTPTIDYDALAAKHGATPAPVDYDALASQHGGTVSPANSVRGAQVKTSPESKPSTLQQAGEAISNFGKGAVKGIGSTLNSVGSQLNKIGFDPTPEMAGHNTPAANLSIENHLKTHGLAQGIGKGIEQAGEFMIPGGAEESAASHLAALAPKIGKAALPLARIGTSALSSGLVNKAQGGEFGTGAAFGAGGSVLGSGLKSMASPLAEGALKVRGNQRLFGRTVGDAILNDTKGIRPSTVGKSAQETIQGLTPELDVADQASAASGQRGSLTPARTRIGATIAGHNANRATGTAADLKPVSDFLHTDQLTSLPLSANQSAPGLRSLKRGLNEDYIGKWSPDQPPAQKGAARAAYGDINQELHRISPDTSSIDQRISSLIPVVQQGQRVASGDPTIQRAMGRFGAHTGALTLGGIGAKGGYDEGGVPGAIAGGLAGVLAPELIGSPEGQMMLSRMLNNAKGLKPAVGIASQFKRPKQSDTGDR